MVVISTFALCDLDYLKTYIRPTPTGVDDLLIQNINAATDEIERYCGSRKLKSRSFTEWLDGSGDRVLVLPRYPIVSVERVSVGEVDALGVESNDTAGATEAYVEFDGTNVTITLAGGTNDGSIDIAVSSFTTLTALAAEIEAQVGSWTTSVLAGLGPFESASIRKVGRLYAFEGQAILKIPESGEPEYRVNLEDDNEGMIILERGLFHHGKQNIYVEYTAGYATVPAALQQICAELATRMFYMSNRDTTLKSEKLGDYAWSANGSGALFDSGIKARLAPFKDILPV